MFLVLLWEPVSVEFGIICCDEDFALKIGLRGDRHVDNHLGSVDCCALPRQKLALVYELLRPHSTHQLILLLLRPLGGSHSVLSQEPWSGLPELGLRYRNGLHQFDSFPLPDVPVLHHRWFCRQVAILNQLLGHVGSTDGRSSDDSLLLVLLDGLFGGLLQLL